ncbi:effector-associated constant component EACC1 [Streptomyces xinghaiensis]|uniref:effector-associated constant component EACC1 n=1 Tax=Streptomyces xinghaiensis TaxID=1038928 RepID=UPI002E13059A|nr:hypothetical protein OG463_12045 [Streptomyces xinghaiensis]
MFTGHRSTERGLAAVRIRIGVDGVADTGRELHGIAGWLGDDAAFTDHWRFTEEPAPGRAGLVEAIVVTVVSNIAAATLHEQLNALFGGLAGWLRSRRRLGSGGDDIVVRVELENRDPLRFTAAELDDLGVPEIVDRVRAELEAGTAGEA